MRDGGRCYGEKTASSCIFATVACRGDRRRLPRPRALGLPSASCPNCRPPLTPCPRVTRLPSSSHRARHLATDLPTAASKRACGPSNARTARCATIASTGYARLPASSWWKPDAPHRMAVSGHITLSEAQKYRPHTLAQAMTRARSACVSIGTAQRATLRGHSSMGGTLTRAGPQGHDLEILV